MRTLLPAIAAIVVLTGCAQTYPKTSIVGTWSGLTSTNQTASLTFRENGTMTIAVGGETATGKYVRDGSARPIALTMGLDKRGIVSTIIEFPAPNKLRLENVNPWQKRPSRFSKNSIILTKE